MWERFTEAARRSVFLAQEDAKLRGQQFVSTEHLLLGLIREDGAIAMRILMRLEISPHRIQAEIEQRTKSGPLLLNPDMQLTPRAKFVLNKAFIEARQLQHRYVGTEHILLGIIEERNGLGGQVLIALGADIEKARRVARELAAEKSAKESANDSSGPAARNTDAGLNSADSSAKTIEESIVSRGLRSAPSVIHICVAAMKEAASLGDAELAPEHLLLAILGAPESEAFRLLHALEIPTEPIRTNVLAQMVPDTPVAGTDVMFAARTKLLLARALAEAQDAGQVIFDTQHLLLALLEESESIAGCALQTAGLNVDRLRDKIRRLQNESKEA